MQNATVKLQNTGKKSNHNPDAILYLYSAIYFLHFNRSYSELILICEFPCTSIVCF